VQHLQLLTTEQEIDQAILAVSRAVRRLREERGLQGATAAGEI